ncbi:MAG: hypothetical protein CMN28_04890 [Salinisphaeraceae bacterium]|nr:hypothetical protein [Salinisphaeraceae bacterium]
MNLSEKSALAGVRSRPSVMLPSTGFHDRPIGFKLTAIVVGFVVVVCLLMTLFLASLGALTGVRAYVRAESLWTNGQKDAAFNLSRYVYSGNPAQYEAFREALERPLQHHIARTEMLKPSPDFRYRVARDALVTGGNSAADAPFLIFAFRYLGGYGKINEAIGIWTDADPYILDMNELGRSLHRRMQAGGLSEAEREAAMDELLALNAVLTPKEIGFSAAINEASRLISILVLITLLGSMLLLLAAAIYFSWSITRMLSAAVEHLSDATVAVGEGHLDHRVPILAGDELGRLSAAFNDMVAYRQQAEIEEEMRREFMTAVLDNLEDAVVACDAQGRLSYFNSATERLHSDTPNPLPPEMWARHYQLYAADGVRLLDPDEIPLMRAFRGEVVSDQEIVIKGPGREPRTATVSGQAIVTPDGRKLGAVVAMHDITERKRAEEALLSRTEQLARSNEELSQFAYVASHGLQEPLRTISSHTQMLVRRLGGQVDPEQLEFTHYIVEAAHRMRAQIEGLLDYSRVGRDHEEPSMVDLGEIFDEVMVDLETAIGECDADVQRDALPRLYARPRGMARLFQNLIANSVKFRAERPPVIRVWAERQGKYWQISVRDNGIGIRPEYAKRVFRLYQRLNSREAYAGNGLGLAICRKIVEDHGGRIWVEPAEPGCIFRFTLAAELQAEHSAA